MGFTHSSSFFYFPLKVLESVLMGVSERSITLNKPHPLCCVTASHTTTSATTIQKTDWASPSRNRTACSFWFDGVIKHQRCIQCLFERWCVCDNMFNEPEHRSPPPSSSSVSLFTLLYICVAPLLLAQWARLVRVGWRHTFLDFRPQCGGLGNPTHLSTSRSEGFWMRIHEKETKLWITGGQCERGQSRLFYSAAHCLVKSNRWDILRLLVARIIKQSLSSLTEQTVFVLIVTSD